MSSASTSGKATSPNPGGDLVTREETNELRKTVEATRQEQAEQRSALSSLTANIKSLSDDLRMVSDNTNRQIQAVNEAQQQRHDQLDKRLRMLHESRRTPWGVVFAAAGVAVMTVAALGALAMRPGEAERAALQSDVARLTTRQGAQAERIAFIEGARAAGGDVYRKGD